MKFTSFHQIARLCVVLLSAGVLAVPLPAQVDTLSVPPEYMQMSVSDLMEQGNSLFNQQQYREARAYYAAVVKQDTTQGGAWARLSETEYNMYNLSDAQKFLAEALGVEPGNEEWRARFQNISKLVEDMSAGIEAQRNRNYEPALEKFDEVLRAYPGFAPALYHKGLVYRAQNQPDSSSYYFRNAIQADPTSARYRQALGNLAKSYFQDGIENYRRGNLSGAEQSFRTTTRIDSSFKQGHYMLGMISRRRGNVQNAIESYQRALEADPEYEQAWHALGIAYKSIARDNQALEAFTRAAEINPNYTKAHNERGLILTKQENFRAAAQAFQQAIQTNAQYAPAYEGLGIVYQKQGQYQQAANQFQTAVQFDSDNANVYYRLSEVYAEMNDWDLVKENANHALELKTNYAPALISLGDAECHMGNLEAAKSAWNKAKSDAQWRPVAEHRNEILDKTGECD